MLAHHRLQIQLYRPLLNKDYRSPCISEVECTRITTLTPPYFYCWTTAGHGAVSCKHLKEIKTSHRWWWQVATVTNDKLLLRLPWILERAREAWSYHPLLFGSCLKRLACQWTLTRCCVLGHLYEWCHRHCMHGQSLFTNISHRRPLPSWQRNWMDTQTRWWWWQVADAVTTVLNF